MKAVMHFGHLANQMPPQNAWPQFGEFVGGDPHYARPVDPDAFNQDLASLRWDRSLMTKELSPAAMGQSLMKQYLWAQDMLGSFHDAAGKAVAPDGTVTPDRPDGTFDPDTGVYYGGDSLDGFVGQVLTAEAINKVKNLIDNLAFDRRGLGPVDPSSVLFDQASLLWGVVHFVDMMDPGPPTSGWLYTIFAAEPWRSSSMATWWQENTGSTSGGMNWLRASITTSWT